MLIFGKDTKTPLSFASIITKSRTTICCLNTLYQTTFCNEAHFFEGLYADNVEGVLPGKPKPTSPPAGGCEVCLNKNLPDTKRHDSFVINKLRSNKKRQTLF